MAEARTKYGVFVRGQPKRVKSDVARALSVNYDFCQLVAVKYDGKDAARSLRLPHGRIIALPKGEPRLVPVSLVYKLQKLPEFEFIPEEQVIPSLLPENGIGPPLPPRIPSSQHRWSRAPVVNVGSLGERGDGAQGSIIAAPKRRYRLGVFTARPQGYISGGYFHVWMTANVLCKFFDVTLVVPAMPTEYIRISKHSELKIILDTNYLLDLGYSPFDMIMSLHGTCGEIATKYSTRYNVPVYLHCFEPGNLVKEKLHPNGPFSEQAWEFRRQMYKRVDYVLCSNPYCQDWARKWIDEDPRKIVSCVPPLNFKTADMVPDQEERHEIVFISRMIDYKRPLDMIEIAIRVDRSLTLNYIGAHSRLNKKVEEVAKREGIRVNFYDAITEEEKFKIIKQSKFMVFPSRFEGFGLPPAEALYCGKPCIAYDIPILRENYKDMLEFAKERDTIEMCRIADHLLKDPEYRKQRGAQGRAFIKDRLSFEACEESYKPIMPPVRVSFIVIVFEGGDYLKQCLEQIYPHAWEILIAEGAVRHMANLKGYWRSKDDTIDIIKKFPDPENKIHFSQINNRPWKDKAEMKLVLLRESTGHIIWQVDHDEFYKHQDIKQVIQEFIDDASLDLVETLQYHFWRDFSHHRMDGKWGQCKFTRIWRKRGSLDWTYHDCPHRDGKPYRGNYFKGKQMGRILYHYGYVRKIESVSDKIEFLSSRDTTRADAYHSEFEQWKAREGGEIRTFDGKHPEVVQRMLDKLAKKRSNDGKESIDIDDGRGVALPA